MRHLFLFTLLVGCAGGEPSKSDPDDTDTDTVQDGTDADGDGVTVGEGDCDDADPGRFPGNEEICNNVDDDCDRLLDNEAVDARAWFRDDDGDNFGRADDSVVACRQIAGYSLSDEDCDDEDGSVHPGAVESCDGDDEDCDDEVDESAFDAGTYWVDADGDGRGDPDRTVRACAESAGVASNAADCDDAESAVYTGAPEVTCDGLDNDCDPTPPLAVQALRDGVAVATLAAAISGASEGAAITLCEGIYETGPLLIAVDGLVLTGLGVDPLTKVESDGTGAVLRLAPSVSAELHDLVLTGGTGWDTGGGAEGGGLFLGAGASVLLEAVEITGNSATRGAGIALASGASVSGEALVHSNTAGEGGGGLYAAGHNTISGLTLRANVVTAGEGGGAHLTGPATVQEVVLDDNAVTGAAAALWGTGSLVFTDVSVVNHVATGSPSTVRLNSASSTWTGCTLTGNGGTDDVTVRVQGGTLISVDTDWGVGASDNDAIEVELSVAGGEYAFAGVQSFVCTDVSGGVCE